MCTGCSTSDNGWDSNAEEEEAGGGEDDRYCSVSATTPPPSVHSSGNFDP